MGYFGSKATAGLCQPLIAMMPPHATYIETHLGSGAIMRRKPPALRNIGIDLDGAALAGFSCAWPVELVHGCCHRFDELFLKYPFYGARQMVRHLRREGVRIGRRRAARLMRLLGLQAVYRAPRTSAPHPEHRVYPYLLRDLGIERANHVWCADITYIPVRRGFLYLVAIMDWASRHVLAWRLSNTLDAGFCTDALDEALAAYGTPEIFNTDQGSQFTSFAFTARLREAGIRISMDGRGRCMDNIFIERLWRSLKYEAVYLHEIADGFTARRVIGEWIAFYNTIRPHSALGGRTPAEAYRGDTPVDMMDKPLRALTTYPQAQQQQQKDRFKGILAA